MVITTHNATHQRARSGQRIHSTKRERIGSREYAAIERERESTAQHLRVCTYPDKYIATELHVQVVPDNLAVLILFVFARLLDHCGLIDQLLGDACVVKNLHISSEHKQTNKRSGMP
jgi:hypothetical protein